MAIYNTRDISLTLDGDIEIGANGDIKLATSHESVKNQVNWFLRTDRGQYQPNSKLGCNVGIFMGDSMSNDMLISMEDTVRAALHKYVVLPQDINVDALPLSYDQVGVFVTLIGQYLDDDGNLLDVIPEVITYTFPFLEGSPSAI
jgi:hypothetical protein